MNINQAIELRAQLAAAQAAIDRYLHERLMPDWGYLAAITPAEASQINRCAELLLEFSAADRRPEYLPTEQQQQHE